MNRDVFELIKEKGKVCRKDIKQYLNTTIEHASRSYKKVLEYAEIEEVKLIEEVSNRPGLPTHKMQIGYLRYKV